MLNKTNKLSKKSKIAISCLSVLVALIVIGAILISANSTWFYSNAMYALMPKEIVAEMDAGTLKMGVTKSGEKSAEVIEKAPLSAYRFYYYDTDGTKKEVGYLEDFQFGDETVDPSLVFSLAANKNLNTLKSVISKVIIVLVVLIIAIAVLMWYKAWSKHEDAEKAMKHKKNNTSKSKKK